MPTLIFFALYRFKSSSIAIAIEVNIFADGQWR